MPTYEEFLAEDERRRREGDWGQSTSQVATQAPPPNEGPLPDNSEDVGTFLARRSLPFASAYGSFAETQNYNQAREAIASGRGYEGDQNIVASYEAQQRRDEARGTGGQILAGLASVPAMAGEAAFGGAVLGRLAPSLSAASTLSARGAGRVAATTAFSPSFYLPQAAQRAAENGGAWYEPQNLGVAGTMGMAQVAILGSLPNIGNSVRGNGAGAILARLGLRTGTGMAEQGMADVIGGAVDNILPEAYQTRTRYGLVGDAMRGEWGHFWQHAAVQAVTFAAFSALHPGEAEQSRPESQLGKSPTEIIAPEPARLEAIPEASREFPAPSSLRSEPMFSNMPLSRGTGVIEAFRRASDAMNRDGISRKEAGEAISRVTDAVQSELAAKGRLSPEEAKALVDGLKFTGAAKTYAEALLEAANRPGNPTPPLPGDRDAARGTRAEPRPVPPEMVAKVNPAPISEVNRPSLPPFRAEMGRQYDPKDDVGRAMLAKRFLKAERAQRSAEPLPRPRTEPTTLPGFMRPREGPPRPPEAPPARTEPPKAPSVPKEAPKGLVASKKAKPATVTPELRAEFERKLAEAGLPAATLSERQVQVQQERLAAGLPVKEQGKMVAQGPHTGDNPIPEMIANAIDKANLPAKEREAIEGWLAGNSLRALEEPLGVSRTTVQNRAREAWQKIIDANPALAKKYPTFADYVHDVKMNEVAELVSGPKTVERATRADAVLEEVYHNEDMMRKELEDNARQIRAAENAQNEASPADIANLRSKSGLFGANRMAERPPGQTERLSQGARGLSPEPAKSEVPASERSSVSRHGIIADGELAIKADKWENLMGVFFAKEWPKFQEKLDSLSFNDLREEARSAGINVTGILNRSQVNVVIENHVASKWRDAQSQRLGMEEGESLSVSASTAPPKESSSTPITPAELKAVSDLSIHHASLVKKVQGMVMEARIPSEKKLAYFRNQLTIFSNMTETAAALHSAGMRQMTFFGTTHEIGEALASTSKEARDAVAAGDVVGGSYNAELGRIILDGGTTVSSAPRIAGHEAAHAMDGRRLSISDSPEFRDAWKNELVTGGPIGEYARTNPQEGFAEIMGLLLSGEMSPKAVRDFFPQTARVLESRGLMPAGEGASFKKQPDIFNRAINDGPLHADVLADRLHLSPPEKTMIEKAEEIAKFAADASQQTLAGGKIANRAQAKAKELGGHIWESARYALDNLAQLSGKGFINTTRASREVGEAMGRFVASKVWVQQAIPDIVDRVLGPKASEEFRHQAGAALMEMSMRAYKAKLLEQNQLQKAEAVRTFVKDRSNSTTNAVFDGDGAYQAFIDSAQGKKVIEAYKQHVTPELHELWRRYKSGEGELTDADPITGNAQIPDLPINFMRIEPGEIDSPFFVGGGRGNLKNPKQGKLVFDKDATRAHPQYETDLAKIMEHSFNQTVGIANKRAMYNEAIRAGLAEKGPSGGRGTLPNGDKVWEVPKVYGDGHSLYVSERIADEMRQAIATDKPQSIPFVTEASKLLNRAMGAALAEPVSHLKNQLTALMQVGVNPLEMIPNALKVIRGDVGVQKQILELAKINAFRGGHGLESGQLWGGKYDPTHWVGKLINVMDSAARLTLKAGYERNVRLGRTSASETGLRDFVNQGLGDYNKLSQHKLVVLLRDLGIGPFATAGTKFYMSGMRLLTLDPGMKATSTGHAIAMRAEILAKLVAVVGAVALANKALWKNNLGDDDTPLGAIKTGKTEDGKSTYFDLTAFTGLTRGFRQTGLLALSEGLRQGSSAQRIGDRGTEAFFTSLMHPMEGPVVNFAHTLITGRDTFGRDAIPPESAGGSRALESLRAAGIQANPFLAAGLGYDKKAQDMSYGARVLDMLGPFNPFKERGDQILGELRGRLRELDDQRKAFYTRQENISRPFAREAEYRVLRRFDDAVGKLNNVISGTAQTQQGRRQIERPDAARVRELRKQVTDLARQALSRQREYQGL